MIKVTIRSLFCAVVSLYLIVPAGAADCDALTVQTPAATLVACVSALAQSVRGGSSAVVPVGTIVASTLPPADFAQVIGETEGDVLTNRTWLLADGRDVTGTRLARLTNGMRLPDLRGMFLRGVTDNRDVGTVQEYATALPKVPFTGFTSTDGALTLPRSANPSAVDRYNAGGRDYWVIVSGPEQPVAAHSHQIQVAGGGDTETRPVNVAVFYYIKVN